MEFLLLSEGKMKENCENVKNFRVHEESQKTHTYVDNGFTHANAYNQREMSRK